MKERKILLGLTTTTGSDWREKIKETKIFGITEIALFLTGLKKEERKELYELLSKSPIKSIPHVHLRSDSNEEEMEYLMKHYNTVAFNHHPFPQFPFEYDLSKYFHLIFLENTEIIPTDEELKVFGGICIDFAHLESANLTNNPDYDGFKKKIKKYKIGCCHISAIKDELNDSYDPNHPNWKGYDYHCLDDLKEVHYIKKYISYLPEFVSIELENSFKDQLRVKGHLESIINN